MSRTTLGIDDNTLLEYNKTKSEYEYIKKIKKKLSNAKFLKIMSIEYRKLLKE